MATEPSHPSKPQVSDEEMLASIARYSAPSKTGGHGTARLPPKPGAIAAKPLPAATGKINIKRVGIIVGGCAALLLVVAGTIMWMTTRHGHVVSMRPEAPLAATAAPPTTAPQLPSPTFTPTPPPAPMTVIAPVPTPPPPAPTEPLKAPEGPAVPVTPNITVSSTKPEVIAAKSVNAEVAQQLRLAMLSQNAGAFEEALKHYNAAIAIDPFRADVYNNMGIAYQELGNLQRAVESYRKALALKANDPKALANLGAALYLMGDTVGAESSSQSALAQEPKDLTVYNNLGLIFVKEGDSRRAEDMFRRALGSTEPRARAMANYNLARLYDRIGNKRSARVHYLAFLQAAPGQYPQAAAEVVTRLEAMGPEITEESLKKPEQPPSYPASTTTP